MHAPILLLALQLAPLDRAVEYLHGEVAKWRTGNGCFSCHNNGDGARALAAAGRTDPATWDWLRHPSRWDSNAGDPAVSDKKLARIQFANALTAVAPAEKEAICEAASMLVKDQDPDGSFRVDQGSPVTYGTPLATHYASQVLGACGAFPGQTAAARKYLETVPLANVADASARLLSNASDARARAYLNGAQNPDGGWGQYPKTPSEPFDTALALIALRNGPTARAGRTALLRMQEANGGWPPTTRPPGAQSYAQHVSTTSWAVLALLGNP